MFEPKKSPLNKNLGSSGDETNFIWSGKIIQWFITWLKVQKSSSFSDILKKVKTFCLQLYTSSPYFSCSLLSSFSWLPHWHGGAKTNSNYSFRKTAKIQTCLFPLAVGTYFLLIIFVGPSWDYRFSPHPRDLTHWCLQPDSLSMNCWNQYREWSILISIKITALKAFLELSAQWNSNWNMVQGSSNSADSNSAVSFYG